MNNPAARLLNILEQGGKKPKDKNCRLVWCELLNIDPNDKVMLFGRLGKVIALSSDIVDELQKIDGVNVERYMHWAKPLENAFFESTLSGQWHQFNKHVNEHVFNYLTMTSDFLSYRAPQPILPKTDLDKIVDGARKLLDEIKQSDLTTEIKEYMIKQLQKICIAADEYQITGSKYVVDVIDATFGHAILKNDLVKSAQNNTVAKKFWKFMANAAVITTIATGALQLAPAVSKILPEIDFEPQVKIEKVVPVKVDKVENKKLV